MTMMMVVVVVLVVVFKCILLAVFVGACLLAHISKPGPCTEEEGTVQ
jgi:hypothetical protein